MTDQPEIIPDEEQALPELETLRQSLEVSKKSSAEYYDQLLRLRAEFENFRKRAEREKIESLAWGKEAVLGQLISLVDVFDQAMDQAQKAKEMKQVVEGLEMLHKNFARFLKAEGLQPIEVVGKPFDPHWAEAVEQVEVDADQVGLVLSELQKGYMHLGRVLRPGRVRVGVARKPDAE